LLRHVTATAFPFSSPCDILRPMTPKLQPENIISQINSSKTFFENSTRALEEADSNFRPGEGTFTAAQQVAHTAQTIEWFIDGIRRPEGFDLDFEKHAQATNAVTSLTAARAWLDKAYANAIEFLKTQSADDLARTLPPGPIMGGQPVSDVFWGLVDHTAHHRGALTVYARLLGKVPPMPYM